MFIRAGLHGTACSRFMGTQCQFATSRPCPAYNSKQERSAIRCIQFKTHVCLCLHNETIEHGVSDSKVVGQLPGKCIDCTQSVLDCFRKSVLQNVNLFSFWFLIAAV